MKLRDVKRLGIAFLCVSMLMLPAKSVNATGTTYYGTGTTAGNNYVVGGTGTTAGNNNTVGENNNNTDSNNNSNTGNNGNSNNSNNNQQDTKPENTEKPNNNQNNSDNQQTQTPGSSNNQNNSDNQQSQKPENDDNQQSQKPESDNNQQNQAPGSNSNQQIQKPENDNNQQNIKPENTEKPDNNKENNSEDDQKPGKEEENKNDEQESAGNLGGNITKEENPVPSVEEDEDWKSDSYYETGTSVRGEVEGVPSTTEGSYLAKGVNGCAVVTSEEQIKQDYGLIDMDTVYAGFSDLNPEEKPVSAQMLQIAVSSQGGEIGPMLNIDLGKMNYGSYSRLNENGAKIEIALGIPESFYAENMTYGVVCIRKDGTMEVCRDTDSKQSTVTFQTKGGVGAYALYRYENKAF